MLADTPLPHGFGAALASVDTLSKGSRTVRWLPALPCRLRAMGRKVGSTPSSPDNHLQQHYRSHSGNPSYQDLCEMAITVTCDERGHSRVTLARRSQNRVPGR